MTDHSHIMGGSTAEQRIQCPGSMKLEAQMPERPSSDFAREGSMLHAAMELIIADEMPEDALDEFLGQDLGFDGLKITKSLIEEKLKPARRAFWRIVEEWGWEDWFIEQKVTLWPVPGAFGTIDILAKDSKGRLHVLDWKFGDGVFVDIEGSYQLGFYAAAALYDDEPEIKALCEDVSGVVLHIIQPRLGDDESEHHRYWETDEDWIEKLIDQAERAAKLAQSDDPPIKPGSWCRWCTADPICPAKKSMASEALSKAPESMTALELAEALELADQLKPWIKKVFDLGQQEAEGGAAIPGWKLVQKRGTRVFTDPEAVVKILKGLKWKNAQIFKEREVKTPAQLQKTDKHVFEKRLKELVESRSSGLTLVRESDKREAVADSVALLANAMKKAGVNE